ncbi:hypothetical protein [Pseudomonas phage KP1]|uniref:Virion structural protein n=1 Tax=Pseudomonas phage KP1 TaxID=2562463 RepID=A0A6G5QB14_9CAUD|nr:hypothetical protein PM391_gp19 [Pseudomonas phage KP1]QBZ71729.1 hypothetical protein [Pseudomonas phage KP1]
MAYGIGTLLKAGGDDCHYQLLGVIKTLAEANGWVTLRYVNTGADRELILKGEGLSGLEEIYIGFKTYQNSSLDYYNINCGVFVGYVSGSTFETQPGARFSGMPAHNNAITYFINVNPQRIVGCLKVATPVYEHFYLGRFFPYSKPGEYPAPLVCGSMFNGAEAKRFSDTNHIFPYSGYTSSTTFNNMYNRNQAGAWVRPNCYPFTQGNVSGSNTNLAGWMVPADVYYQIEPIIIQQNDPTFSQSNLWGELDGVYHCTGFNNGVENVIQVDGSSVVDQTGMTVLQAVDAIIAVDGRALVMLQNVNRTTFADYIALEMK